MYQRGAVFMGRHIVTPCFVNKVLVVSVIPRTTGNYARLARWIFLTCLRQHTKRLEGEAAEKQKLCPNYQLMIIMSHMGKRTWDMPMVFKTRQYTRFFFQILTLTVLEGIFFAFPFTTLPEYIVDFFSNPLDVLQNRLSDLEAAFTNDEDMDAWLRGIIFARFLCN